MTCIVGMVDEEGKMYMSCDSLWSSEDSRSTSAGTKLFMLGEMLFGVAGSPREMQALQYNLICREQSEDEDDMEFVVRHVVPKIISTLKGASTLLESNGIIACESNLLLAYRGSMYAIMADFAVYQSPFSFYAVGSGADVALGAMAATEDFDIDPEERLEQAITIAAEFIPSVGGSIGHINSDDLEDI